MTTTPLALVGGYTTRGAPGLQSVRVHPSGRLEPLSVLEIESPSCVAWHPTLPVAYATNESAAGGVTAVAIDDAGHMRALGSAPTGGHPCHAAITRDERWLLTADYTGGTVSLIKLAPDGRPVATVGTTTIVGSGPDPERQQHAHPHMIATDVLGHSLICVDLGADTLTSLAITPDGALRQERTWHLPPGTGPRQIVALPDADSALVVGELSATLLRVRLGAADEAEVLAEVPTTTHPERSWPAQLTTYGDSVLVSNRGPDTIAVFTVGTSELDLVSEHPTAGRWPRHFALTEGLLLASNENSSTIEAFELGAGETIGRRVSSFATSTPTWVALRP
ncbi:lactonase family protein [Mumia zhuanghuii]|uniref:Lactonase family protein n=2 Tax=Mumia TaxID=1546255 RepID=A0ABW1QNG9_9ACTN|nr:MULTISPECIES: beta-propeller fold lactonase family protein [Mumia]KAA1423906.1 lactonase family protein [Mumia zhuanghuii]